MHRTISVATALLLAGASAWAADADKPLRTISVTGTCVTRVQPDLVVWTLSTVDENKDMREAKAASDAKMQSIMRLIDELKVKPEDVMTGHVHVRREFFEDERGRPQAFKHWSVRREITIKQRDLNRFDEFFGTLASVGDVEMRFSREASNMEELRWKTRQEAMALAKKKAEEMLAEVDAKLGKVLTVNEHPPADQRRFGAEYGNFSNNAMITMSPEGGGIDAVSGTFAPGTIDMRITVYVTFGIE